MSDRYSIDASAGSVDFLRPPHAEAPVPRMVLPGGKERKVTIGDARKEITDVNQVYEQRKLSIATHRSGHREVDSSPAGPPRLSMGSHRGAVGHSLAMSPGEILPPSPALSREWKAVRVADLPPDAQARAVDTAGLSRLDVARMKSQYGIRQTTGILQRSEIEQVRKRALEDHSSLVTVTKSIAGRAGLVRYDVDPQTQAVTLRATRTKIAEGGGKTIFKVLNMGVPEELQREQGIAIEATGKRGSQKLAAKDEYYGLLLAEQKNPNIVCYRRFDYRESTVTQMEFCGGGGIYQKLQRSRL